MKKICIALTFLFLFSNSTSVFAAKILDVQKFTSEKGIEIWLAENHNIPLISMDFSFAGGLDYEPDNKAGIGKMVSTLLDEGAGEISSKQFQKELNDNSIFMSFTAERDAFSGNIRTLTKNYPHAYSLLQLALTSPRFDKDAIERMRNSNLASIKNNMGDPSWLVARTFNGMLFEGHKYAMPGEGTLKTINQIKRSDLLDFVHAQFARSNLKVAIAGDINKEQAIEAVDSIFGNLPESPAPVDISNVDLKFIGQTIMLSLDVPQSYVMVGGKGISISDPDWYSATVMNYILGGDSFDSHLMKEIREKRGLTYGVYSTLSPMKHTNLIRASMSSGNEKVAQGLQILYSEWQKIGKDGITESELQAAKSYITGSLLLGLASNTGISATLNEMQQQGLDYNYINKYSENINNVTASDVRRVAKNMLDKSKLITIIVGKPAGISPDLILQQAPKMGDDDNEQVNK